MSQSEVNNRYNNTNIDTMQMVYGRGYLSAGGDDEVGRIFQGIDLSDKHILDLGCGLGGASLAMVESLNAEHVTGFDIDENLLTEAQQLIDENSVQSRVSFCHGTPGPLSFSDSEFDLVYMTAVSCHIEDLPPFFEEISRVLKSGGCVVGSEWYRRADNKAYADWDNLLRERGLNFYFKYPDEYTASLQEAGFDTVTYVDRTAEFCQYSDDALQQVNGELRSQFVEKLGETGFEAFLEWTNKRYWSLANGGISQSHFRAYCNVA